MKLKSVELLGFKSFAKKTRIDFPSGITEIVGPNGSGKSNIIEAIRWALGEQSAKNLRSSRMTDVIFSGSQSHPALNRAKVTLVFDNRDHFINVTYTEIKVSRIVFRDGTNNYYLNGKPCRLRDIQDLFMNTGIGNGSFSIISQGKVAQIFKSKPVDRRFIIETVAGIYKYRSQKGIAAKKLTHVDTNLTRVNDLNYELGQRLHNLNKERRSAQQYLKYKRLSNHLNINRLSVRLRQLKQKLIILKKHNAHVSAINVRLNKQINQLHKDNRLTQQRLSKSLKGYNQMQETILNYSQRLDNLTNQNNLKQQKLSFWQKQIFRCQNNLTNNRQQISQLRKEHGALRKQRNAVNVKLANVTEMINNLNLKRRPHLIKRRQSNIKHLQNKYVDLVQRMANIKGQIKYQQQNYQQQKIQKAHVHSQLTDVKGLISQCESKIKGLDDELSRLKDSVAKNNNKISNCQNHYQQIARDFKTIRNQYQIRERKRQVLQIRLNGLKRINARHSNLYNGTRNLLNYQNQFTGIYGPVAKFIKVPNQYIHAIEITLRSQLQQIIVNDDETAKDIVRFMSVNRLGRITLLPISSISKRWISPKIVNQCRQIRGFIDVASNLVKMPSQFFNVKLHLLGNVLITKDISSAIQISRIVHRHYRVVTLKGNVVNAGGAITGGHGHYQYHGLLSQRAKVNQYQATIKDINKKLVQGKNQGINFVSKLNSVKKTLQSNQNQLAHAHQNQVIKDNLKIRLLAELKNYQKILNHRHKLFNLGSYQNSVNDLTNQIIKIRSKLTQNHQKLTYEQKNLHQLMIDNSHYDKQYQIYREDLIKLRDQEAQTNKDIHNNSDQLTQIRKFIIKNNRDINHYTRTIRDQSRRVHSNANLNQLSKKIDQLTAKKMRFHKLVTHNQLISKQIRPKLSKVQSHLIDLRNQINQGQLTERDVNRKISEIAELLFRKYQINVTKDKLPDPQISLYQISSKLFNAQKRLQVIGPVNVNSIDQFKKVNHRYQFLSKQVNDLVKSKRQLMTTMNQMDLKIKDRFKVTFDRINQAFKITYSQIFKGGRAKLTLQDPKHLLTTGINIMAQPPGKRYRNMELLSGGERALTAIALLFAILKIKPAPFCILDEAESALDAVNIDRFGDYMQKLKAKTQFIVITHRKTTMLYADNLYGVTMQDSGISKVISVNLKRIKTEG